MITTNRNRKQEFPACTALLKIFFEAPRSLDFPNEKF